MGQPAPRSAPIRGALIRLHSAVFLWGFTGVLGRLISLREGWLVWWRLAITVATLWIVFLATRQARKISWRGFFKLGAGGALLALHWLCFYGSIKFSNVSIALTCLSTSGLVSAVIEPIVFRRRVNFKELVLGFFALGGIAVIYLSNLHFSIGIYVGLFATLLTVMASVLNKKLVGDFETSQMMIWQLTAGFLALTLLMPVYYAWVPDATVLPQHADWLWLFILSWVCTLFTYVLYVRALRRVSAFTINLTLTLEPVYGILLAFAVFHENKSLSPNFYIGLALILTAVLLQMQRMLRAARTSVPEIMNE